MTIKIDEEYRSQRVFSVKLIILRQFLFSKEKSSEIIKRYSNIYSLSDKDSKEMQSILVKGKDELIKIFNQSVNNFISGKYLREIQNPDLIKYSYEYQKNNFIKEIANYVKRYGLKIPLHSEYDAFLFGENPAKINFVETLIALEFENLISIISLQEGVSKPHKNTYQGWEIPSMGQTRSDFITFQVPTATIKLKRKLINLIEPNLSYESFRLSFKGKEILIPEGDQDALCKVLFRDKKSMLKHWSYDEILEAWGGNYENKDAWRKVYNAGREINKKVAISTTIDDLIGVKTKTTFVNPKYLPSQAK
ncbi:hypothetical protein GYA19_01250 [Candidatus Beckwithbacteria bacterium]|nr:hypothetical protein [Candidatus Beckwithbacteria bacterium]